MAEIPIKNSGKNPLSCAGMMIAPGETRMVEASRVPPHLIQPKPAEKPEQKVDPLLAILDHKVADVVEMFPGLSDDELAALKVAEQNGNTRKSLMSAIAEEELKRADAKAGGPADDQPTDPDSSDNDNSEGDEATGAEGSGDADNNSNE